MCYVGFVSACRLFRCDLPRVFDWRNSLPIVRLFFIEPWGILAILYFLLLFSLRASYRSPSESQVVKCWKPKSQEGNKSFVPELKKVVSVSGFPMYISHIHIYFVLFWWICYIGISVIFRFYNFLRPLARSGYLFNLSLSFEFRGLQKWEKSTSWYVHY